jgi:hypothetical protein
VQWHKKNHSVQWYDKNISAVVRKITQQYKKTVICAKKSLSGAKISCSAVVRKNHYVV